MAEQTFTSGQILTAAQMTTLQTDIGLNFVLQQTIGAGVTSVVVPSAFSTTYDNYKIFVTGGAGSTTSGVFLKLGASATGYYAGQYASRYDNGGGSFTGYQNGANFQIGRSYTDTISIQTELLSPFLAKPTTIRGDWNDTRVIAGTGPTLYSGVHTPSTSYTDFTLTFDTGTFTGGSIVVLGYRKS
jgi:hypothetical protein